MEYTDVCSSVKKMINFISGYIIENEKFRIIIILWRAIYKKKIRGLKTLVKDLNGKKGSYDACFIPEGLKEYGYTKDGKAGRRFGGFSIS